MSRVIPSVVLLSLCFAFACPEKSVKFYDERRLLIGSRKNHQARDLSDHDIQRIANLSDYRHFEEVLEHIMVPRVVGTAQHKEVGDYIVRQMSNLGWSVEEDKFTDVTPTHGRLKFRNIIARMGEADRYIALACHYDSKYTREHVFIGATDSAVPCAMMINLAKVLKSRLDAMPQSKVSLMFIFFDGEEAFRQWGPTDSIYGARHLAKKWQDTEFRDGASELQRMDMLVLLDLLGAPDPVFYSYFQATEKWYVRLASAEQRLASLSLLRGYSRGREEQTYFRLRSSGAHIEDDHVPFLRRNVPIVHLITSPFPSVWHTAGDDRSALDPNTIENLNKILRIFVVEYLHLNP